MSDVPSPVNDDTKMLFRVLADMQWHDYGEIRDALAQAVPPGRAIRKYDEVARQNNQSLDHPDETKIYYGQRKCAQIAISSWLRGGGIEQQGPRKKREIRVRPGFTSAGIPGFEPPPDTAAQDPPVLPQGYTEVPQQDSEPSESERGEVEPLSEDPAEVEDTVAGAEPGSAAEVGETLPEGPFAGHGPSPYDWPRFVPQVLPECDACGLAVSNEAKHDSWHLAQSQAKPVPEMALLDESQLKDVVRDVMGQGLDRFQYGMQNWLSDQFLQLEARIRALQQGEVKWKSSDVWRPQR